MSSKENNFENTFADNLEGEDEWENKIDCRLNTEAAKRIYKQIWRETEKDLRNVNDLMAEYYRDNEKELKTELKDHNKFSRTDKEYGFKKQIEKGNINSSTLEIFVARYSWMIFYGESKGEAIESILQSLSNFTQTFEKAVEKEYEMNLDNGAEKEINEEDFGEFLNEVASENGDKTNSITIDDVIDYAKTQAKQKVEIDALSNKAIEAYEEEIIEDGDEQYVGKDILEEEIKDISRDFKQNIMDGFIEKFINQNVTEDMIEEFNKASNIREKFTDLRTWIERTFLNMQDDFMDEAANSATTLGSKTPYVVLLMCGLSIGLIFGVPITPSVVSGAAASTAVITK